MITNRINSLFIASLFILICTVSVFSQEDNKLKNLNNQISELNAKLEGLKKEENSILNDIYKLELMYDVAVVENNKLKVQLRDEEVAIEAKNAEKGALELRIQNTKKNLAKIVRILYKVGSNTYMKMFIRIDNLDDLFKNYRLFMALIGYKTSEIDQLKKDIKRMDEINRELLKKYQNLKAIQSESEQKVRAMHDIRQEKFDMIKKIVNDRENYTRMIDELESEAARLNDMMVNGKTHAKPLKVLDLPKLKGKLKWPIDGKVVSFFGKKKSTKFDTYILNNGIQIKPSGQDNVKAIYSGEVVFAEYFKGYGNLIIIQHAKNLYTLSAHCEKLLKKTGDEVVEGETVAIAGDTGSTSGKVLYFEIRTHIQPVDPLEWLKKRR